MFFKHIRNATSIIEFGGVKFIVDPWLAPMGSYPPMGASLGHPDFGDPRPYPLSDLTDTPENIMKQAQVVIATHLHFDHFDEVAIKSLPKEMSIYAQDSVDVQVLSDYGFKDVRVLESQGSVFEGVTLFKTGCSHGIPGQLEELYSRLQLRSEACGVVFKHLEESEVLYLAGDTIWCDHVEKALAVHKPSIIVVNSAEATIQGYGRIIMGLEDIGYVFEHISPTAVVIASHMDNVGHSALWRTDLHAYANQHGLQRRLLIPEDGEICKF